MKYLLLLLSLLLCSSFEAQVTGLSSKQIKNAQKSKEGREILEIVLENNGEYVFSIIEFDQYYETKKIEKIVKNLDCIIYDFEKAEFDRYGRMQTAYKKITITTPELLSMYNSYVAREEAKRARRKSIQQKIVVGGLVAGPIVLYKGLDKMASNAGYDNGMASLLEEAEKESKQVKRRKRRNSSALSEPSPKFDLYEEVTYSEKRCIKKDRMTGNYILGTRKLPSYEVTCGDGSKKQYLYLYKSYKHYNPGYYQHFGDDIITSILNVMPGEPLTILSENDNHIEKDSPILEEVLEKLCRCGR